MRDSLLFDMDGTLVDWRVPIAISWTKTFEAHHWNKTLRPDDFRLIAGHTTAEIGKMCFPDIDPAESYRRIAIASQEEIPAIRKNATWEECYLPDPDFLNRLSRRYRLFIVSNCMAGYIESFLDLYGSKEAVTDYRDNRNGRSKGQNIKELVEKYHLKSPLYIGDTIMDWEACQEAGVDFLYAAYGFGKADNVPSIRCLAELENKDW